MRDVLSFLSYHEMAKIENSAYLFSGFGMIAGIKRNKKSVTVIVCDETNNIFEGDA
jgi:hypothetical protein